ncbi:hypothetical protein MnTg02_02547 [bacterium MnTg02]|nr:hypothetical protein MnTg02_02547 [bacterium MnTg02]
MLGVLISLVEIPSHSVRSYRQKLMAETRKDALVAFDAFVEIYGVKYDKAVACLTKDRDTLLAFYDFPAEHWKHLRTGIFNHTRISSMRCDSDLRTIASRS